MQAASNEIASESSFNDEESEDELIMSDFDASFEKLGRGFPNFNFGSIWSGKGVDNSITSVVEPDYGHWSRRFQMNTFLNDLQKGLSFSNALNRLQTIKAITEQAISNTMKSKGGDSREYDTGALKQEEPAGLIPAVKPQNAPAYNDMVIPQDKDPYMLEEDLLRLTELPEDQNSNQEALRQRIQQIQSLEVIPAKKAFMVQRLMMGKHVEDTSRLPTPQPQQQLRDPLPTELEKTPTHHDSGNFGCQHYQRNCKLQCHQCLGWYTCRFCHDESPETIEGAIPHSFQRAKTEHIICMRCQHIQKPQKYCESCDEELALYYCNECKLFDNDETKDIYHCDKCGICRLGLGLGIDFFHCDGCQACLSIELQGNHNCIERATMSSCPICGDFMFTSVKPVVYMSPCGHAIHQHCFDEYTNHSYKCPSCQVSILNMEAQFRVLDKEIEEQPLPTPYCDWICYVSCNDCKAKSTCRYHILGLRCGNCISYNTTQIRLVKPEEEPAVQDTTEDDLADANALENLNVMRQELLQGHFQREEVSPLITMEHSGMLSNIEQYMNEYFQDGPEDGAKSRKREFLDYSSQNLFNTAGFFKTNNKRGGAHENENVYEKHRQERAQAPNGQSTPDLPPGTSNVDNEGRGADCTISTASSSMARAPSLTDRLRQFINDAPPQLSISDAFQKFIQGSHQGLSSGDEDDGTSVNDSPGASAEN
ncbi:LADA_0G11958g1_1 [Lachancea dasiensis]|uniref:LADA_0G11958g1_1 n=1 Tax=Lachancea dasiensis TaxID=1072105 RepID=A0A1G4JV42_9SACH|nr:LADA_0G11958g1_1 [Lachancea dasiensis]